MDRIKQAIQRSREEKAAETETTSQLGEGRRAQVSGSNRVQYEKSRKITVANKSLIEKRAIALNEDHRVAAAYKVLRSQILRRMQPRGWNTLAITSASPMEGKTLTAVNLAISMSRQFGNTVLLVDLDLRRPSISTFFDSVSSPGLTDHFLKGVELQDLLFNPGIDNLLVLPAGPPSEKASEFLRSSEMLALTKELKERYPDRYILYDLPPLLVGDEALGFLPFVDCVLLVVEDGKTKPDHLLRAVELMQDSQVIGTVLNKCAESETNRYFEYY